MLAFGLCSHGLADTGNGDLKVAFSDQLYSLEKLLQKNLKTNKMLFANRDLFLNLKIVNLRFSIYISQFTHAAI